MHDEAFDALYERLKYTKADRDSARALFDAGVAAERERIAKLEGAKSKPRSLPQWAGPQALALPTYLPGSIPPGTTTCGQS